MCYALVCVVCVVTVVSSSSVVSLLTKATTSSPALICTHTQTHTFRQHIHRDQFRWFHPLPHNPCPCLMLYLGPCLHDGVVVVVVVWGQVEGSGGDHRPVVQSRRVG